MKHLSQTFIKMGDLGAQKFAATGTPHTDWQKWAIKFSDPQWNDPTPFPPGANVRFIITPSDRYTLGGDQAFPVGMIVGPSTDFFEIWARNTDTASAGGNASFFWLAVADNVFRHRDLLATVPLNQTFIGQPNYFADTNNSGDHQVFPVWYNPAQPVAIPTNTIYNFQNSFGTAFAAAQTYPTFGRPLVFATANNVGCGVNTYRSTRNSAAVGLVMDNASTPMTPNGFNLKARNADADGTCGFNWVALQQMETSGGNPVLPPGVSTAPADLWVDTGEITSSPSIYFSKGGTSGDWFSAEVQFSAPFSTEPVVLASPQLADPQPLSSSGNPMSCAPVPVVQNVTRFGFTLAARNTDNNSEGGFCASFYWVAFGTAA